MKIVGIGLLLTGFLWIAWDTGFGFTEYQYTQWMWLTKNLPAGDTIKRDDASKAIREASLSLKDRHRVIFAPALLM